MVYVNDKKFACETCIKGHRSSSCSHTDRPLYEIKKKGRPVSQCERCRQLRQVKKKHTKCTCAADGAAEQAAESSSSGGGGGAKSRRFIPIAPALPNGLQDALATPVPSGSTSKGDACPCDGARQCKCMSGENAHEADGASPPSSTGANNSGLAALAQAAALCCREAPPLLPPPALPLEQTNRANKHARDSPPGSSHGPKRTKPQPAPLPAALPLPTPAHRGPDLPPIFAAAALPAPPLTIPPLSTFTSLAGSGCCCGLRCACPGCVEHRGPAHAAADREECPGCGSCVDYDGGVELPTQSPVVRMTAALPPLFVLGAEPSVPAKNWP